MRLQGPADGDDNHAHRNDKRMDKTINETLILRQSAEPIQREALPVNDRRCWR
ncbi:hypothetical protein [Pseudovibrio denitrificans]|uniref:hypothetical protein n=1 Tax=Pseudovibrio denitrificans TaxID=258256 RepID=UPI000A8F874A|nr:hypothetical protein [Pseudovibrio denitrificans]